MEGTWGRSSDWFISRERLAGRMEICMKLNYSFLKRLLRVQDWFLCSVFMDAIFPGRFFYLLSSFLFLTLRFVLSDNSHSSLLFIPVYTTPIASNTPKLRP